MIYTVEEYLKRVLEGYRSAYDIKELPTDHYPLVAEAHSEVTESQYVISKKAEVWSLNSAEHAYFFCMDSLNMEQAEKMIRESYQKGMNLIDLKKTKNHMCTRISAVFICSDASEEAIKGIRKCRLYKSFCFSLKGWMEFHAVLVIPGREYVVSNRYGRPTAEFMKSVMSTYKKDKNKLWSIIHRMLQ